MMTRARDEQMRSDQGTSKVTVFLHTHDREITESQNVASMRIIVEAAALRDRRASTDEVLNATAC